MATRPKGYGMTAELSRKIAAKYDENQEQEARLWMEAVVGEPVDPGVSSGEIMGSKRFHEALKDGVYLCKLAQTVTGTPIKINQSKMAFKQMENINNFLTVCEKYGVSKVDLFQTVDLFENQNMWQVVLGIHAFGRKAQVKGFNGPSLGPKESLKNERHFTDEQLKAGQGVIGLQMGSNKGASQSGMSFGGQRFINDMKIDEVSAEGKNIIGLQSGTNKGASQAGMSFGGQRHINDIKTEEMSADGKNIIGLQSGTNQGASAAGQSFGKQRHIID